MPALFPTILSRQSFICHLDGLLEFGTQCNTMDHCERGAHLKQWRLARRTD